MNPKSFIEAVIRIIPLQSPYLNQASSRLDHNALEMHHFRVMRIIPVDTPTELKIALFEELV
jgi:hypothetical protein